MSDEAPQIRYRVDPGDVPPEKMAEILRLTMPQLKEVLPALLARGFPGPDVTTGNFDPEAVKAWESQIGCVYFIRCNEFIKIGYSNDPFARLAGLQTANPYPLALMSYCGGGQSIETDLHTHFRDARSVGEWFKETEELIEVAKCPYYALYRPGGF